MMAPQTKNPKYASDYQVNNNTVLTLCRNNYRANPVTDDIAQPWVGAFTNWKNAL